MPGLNQRIGDTIPKTGTLQNRQTRMQGLTFHIPAAATVTSCSNNRIVTIQEDPTGNRFAVLSPVAVIRNAIQLTIIGWGVLEEALQAGGVSSISPEPNTYKDGETVTVLCDIGDVYMIDYDPENIPAIGIASCRVDVQGRLTSLAAGVGGAAPIQVYGSVFKSVSGAQMKNQLKKDTYFYQIRDAQTP